MIRIFGYFIFFLNYIFFPFPFYTFPSFLTCGELCNFVEGSEWVEHTGLLVVVVTVSSTAVILPLLGVSGDGRTNLSALKRSLRRHIS